VESDICTNAAAPPFEDSNDPAYDPDGGVNNVAVNAPESPAMHVPLDVNVPEKVLLFVAVAPVNVIVSPLWNPILITALYDPIVE
jgi:hypothetical protein